MASSRSDFSDSSAGTAGGGDYPYRHSSSSSIETLRRRARRVRRHIQERNARDILLFLVAFRILNALCVRTFFQPDEFFQSLEPAWQIVFGKESGAWITWEWKHHLRSSIHPYIFATVYWIANQISHLLHLSPLTRADLLIAAPKATQGVFAALGDYYTWNLARKVFGKSSKEAWWALGLTVLSPWQWFCSTRTLSNCLETTLTIAALYYWPWPWSVGDSPGAQRRSQAKRSDQSSFTKRLEQSGLRVCLLLAAFACILRPTNVIIWLSLVTYTIVHTAPRDGFPSAKHVTLIREAVYCGLSVLVVALLADRAYYGSWTLPPFRFLYFNIAQSLAVFYGRNDWHYYLSQGYPLLLTTALPFALAGLISAYTAAQVDESKRDQASIRRQLATVCIIMPAILSLISHKEVRFIYPLLPSLHVLAAPALEKFFGPAVSSASGSHLPRRLLLVFLILANLVIAFYTATSHASGALNVLSYLRQQDERVSAELDTQKSNSRSPLVSTGQLETITVGFLMPCHSTPWRSHLVFPSIDAWALSCEPPVNFNETQRATYLDEADQFYADPPEFLRTHMVGGLRHFPHTPSYQIKQQHNDPSPTKLPDDKHNWPDYLVFFAHLEPTMNSLLRASSYAECYRTWNTAWHDDWRRKGDMVVWCVDPEQQHEWREKTRRVHAHEDGWEALMKSKAKQLDKIIEQLGREGTGVWGGAGSGQKVKRRGMAAAGWMPTMTLPRSWSWGSKWGRASPGVSVKMGMPWGGSACVPWYGSWSWPWEKRRKPSWSQVIRAWYDKIVGDRSESEPLDLWS